MMWKTSMLSSSVSLERKRPTLKHTCCHKGQFQWIVDNITTTSVPASDIHKYLSTHLHVLEYSSASAWVYSQVRSHTPDSDSGADTNTAVFTWQNATHYCFLLILELLQAIKPHMRGEDFPHNNTNANLWGGQVMPKIPFSCSWKINWFHPATQTPSVTVAYDL